MRRPPHPRLRLHALRPLRLGPLRMTPGGAQLPLLPDQSSWTIRDERARGTSFIAITPRSVLNSPASTRMDFWSVNPYIGCEFGCSYCYARDTHRYAVERESRREGESGGSGSPAIATLAPLPPSLAFERRILVKEGAALRLARSLDPAKLGTDTVMIGTATDPYQPAERRFRITRSLLEALAAHKGLSVGIITKSPLVVRDIDLLKTLTERGRATVHISLATFDAHLARRLEARSPIPAARIRALRQLVEAGIEARLLVAPIIPGVTDGRESLRRLLTAARRAGARYVGGGALRLGPAARATFLPLLDREFPHLSRRYRAQYHRSIQAPAAYREALRARLAELRAELGFEPSSGMDD
ncbi:MAG TPA: radical SAM protein [Gemmatimonadales bacterium]|nr:radical SAM protein [Gemmatimonadales bacterium]